MGLLAPWDRTEKCLARGLPRPSLLTLAMLTRCSQPPAQSTINRGKIEVVLPRDPRHFAVKKQTFFLKITDILGQVNL